MTDVVLVLVAVAFGAAVAWLFFNRFRRLTNAVSSNEAADDGPPTAIAAWLEEPMPLSIDDSGEAIARVLGGRFEPTDGGDSSPDGPPTRISEGDDPIMTLLRTIDNPRERVTGDLLVVLGDDGHGLTVISAGRPYFEDVEAVAEDVREARRREAVLNHLGWISVDHVGDPPKSNDEVRQIYGRCGRILASLLQRPDAPACKALFFPRDNQLEPWSDEAMAALQSGNVLSALGANELSPVLLAGGEGYEEEMQAAVQTAQDRWPEFVEAFRSRRTEETNDLFGVKFELSNDGENSEFPWLVVDEIDGGRIDGRLGNDPIHPGRYKFDDPITISLSDVWDWNYPGDDDEVVGLFTNAVIARYSA